MFNLKNINKRIRRNNIMNNASYFIKNRALFGSFPTQDDVNELETNGVKYFIDLTFGDREKNINPYITKYTYINYPIADQYIPYNWKTFAEFIVKVGSIIKNLSKGELIFVHCKGGQGRSGIVVSCIICYIFNLSTTHSINYTTRCRNKRKNMKEKWLKVSCPQTFLQKKFIYKFFEPLVFYRYNRYNIYTYGFSTLSLHQIEIENLGIFNSAQIAYDTYTDKKNLSEKEMTKIMAFITKIKFDRHIDIYNNLLNTGLRPLVEYTKDDNFWSKGEDGKGKNILGKILTNLREEYYKEKYQ